MHLSELSDENKEHFFYCLSPVSPENRERAENRRKWHRKYKSKGYVARVLTLDDGTIAGKCHYLPIEHSPLIGKDLMVILCIYVHRYDRHIGDQRGNGFGRFMIREIEKDARQKGYRGVAAWAMDMEWNSVSFYKHMGYRELDSMGKIKVVYKPFQFDVIPPRLLPVHIPGKSSENKVNVFVSDNNWCDGGMKRSIARAAVKDMSDKVNYQEAACHCRHRHLHLGNAGGIFIEGKPYRPYEETGNVEMLRDSILRIYDEKNSG